MTKIKVTFDEKKLKRDLEKQLRKEIDRVSIENSSIRPNRDDVTMLNKMHEEALMTILELYDGNESLSVQGKCSIFTEYMKFSIKEIFNQLKLSDYIASFLNSLGGWSAYLTPSGISNFEDKEIRERKYMSTFIKLPSNSKQLLQKIVTSDNPVSLLEEKLNNALSHSVDEQIRSLLRELSEYGYIKIRWASNVPYHVQINNSALTDKERELEYQKQINTNSSPIYNDHSINISGNGIVTQGNVINSTLTIDIYINNISSRIEENGGEDKKHYINYYSKHKKSYLI